MGVQGDAEEDEQDCFGNNRENIFRGDAAALGRFGHDGRGNRAAEKREPEERREERPRVSPLTR